MKKRVVGHNTPDTTNNQMELMAARKGLCQIKRNEPAKITVYSDSQYVILGMNEWLTKWQAKGWRAANGQPVKNLELWKELLRVSDGLEVQWEWVRGHNGDPRNEEADLLANQAASKQAQ
ncbi:MAG: ribonuclease H [Paracoccaceae bacterium]|nr:ribonuclease H [Paracoccaceae bacterium]